jgi:hypothetical protein
MGIGPDEKLMVALNARFNSGARINRDFVLQTAQTLHETYPHRAAVDIEKRIMLMLRSRCIISDEQSATPY